MGSGLGSSLAPLPTGMSLMQRPPSSSDHHLSPSGHLTPTGICTQSQIFGLQIRPQSHRTYMQMISILYCLVINIEYQFDFLFLFQK